MGARGKEWRFVRVKGYLVKCGDVSRAAFLFLKIFVVENRTNKG
jgi:hypothetical protein